MTKVPDLHWKFPMEKTDELTLSKENSSATAEFLLVKLKTK